MLISVLNTCIKEELEESDKDTLISPSSSLEESAERRKIIKNKMDGLTCSCPHVVRYILTNLREKPRERGMSNIICRICIG